MQSSPFRPASFARLLRDDGRYACSQSVGEKRRIPRGDERQMPCLVPALAAIWVTAVPVPTELGTLGGQSSNAVSLSASGAVAGSSETAAGATHAFLWTDRDGMRDLGTLGGADSHATAVSSSGAVVGDVDLSTDASHAFLWTAADGMRDLGTLGGPRSMANAVNSAGLVVGTSLLSVGGPTEAFLWTRDRGMIDLGSLGGIGRPSVPRSVAVAVSDSGVVVGRALNAREVTHAFVWTEAGGMVDLGTVGGTYSEAVAVSARGHVVGNSWYSLTVSATHAFLWTATGGMLDLGTLPGGTDSVATAVNPDGVVVGSSSTATSAHHAFEWTPSRGMIDLGTLGGSESVAVAVNAAGTVVGHSHIAGDVALHAFSWSAETGMIDLGPVDARSGDAVAVNDAGQIAGNLYAPAIAPAVTVTRAARWGDAQASPAPGSGSSPAPPSGCSSSGGTRRGASRSAQSRSRCCGASAQLAGREIDCRKTRTLRGFSASMTWSKTASSTDPSLSSLRRLRSRIATRRAGGPPTCRPGRAGRSRASPGPCRSGP